MAETLDRTFSGFEPVRAVPEQGAFFDFLGTKTRVNYLPESCAWLSGQVFGYPAPQATILHEYEEWQGVMAAVREATGSFVCAELGAGWGPWLVCSAFAAKKMGITEILLIGVEAEAKNIDSIKTHFADNGLDHARHQIIHAGVADVDAPANASNPGGAPLLCLNTLLSDAPVVDLIHCDIQGNEIKAFCAGFDAVCARVKRVVIGTHSRRIEDELIDLFRGGAWLLEHEVACRYRIEQGNPYLETDGVQVWRNANAANLRPARQAESDVSPFRRMLRALWQN